MKGSGISAFVIASAVVAFMGWTQGGCSSGDDLTGPETGLSQGQAEALAKQLAGAAAGGIASAHARPEALAPQPQIYIPISGRVNCTAGGRIEVTGNLSGSLDNHGSGVLLIQAQETITDWRCIGGFVINGDPYLSMTGTFSFLNGAPATQQTMNFGGGFKWGNAAAQSCQVILSINFRPDGSGNASGAVCGRNVNVFF